MSKLTVVPREANRLLTCFEDGTIALGLMNKLPGSSHARTLAGMGSAGLDFIIIDGEHGNHDDASIYDCLHAIASLGVSPLVRVPGFGSESWMIKRVLDAGIHGIVVPMTETKAQAEMMASRARYMPEGARGTGACFAHQAFRYIGEDGRPTTYTMEEYAALANQSILVICQIESQLGLDNIEEICSVPGVDAIFMGPFDLAQSMGKLSQDDPKLISALDHIFTVAKGAGKKVIGVPAGSNAKAAWHKGYDAMLITSDVSTMLRGLKEDLAGARTLEAAARK